MSDKTTLFVLQSAALAQNLGFMLSKIARDKKQRAEFRELAAILGRHAVATWGPGTSALWKLVESSLTVDLGDELTVRALEANTRSALDGSDSQLPPEPLGSEEEIQRLLREISAAVPPRPQKKPQGRGKGGARK